MQVTFSIPGQRGNPQNSHSGYSCPPKSPSQSQSIPGGGYQQGLQTQQTEQGSGNMVAQQNSYSEFMLACVLC